MKKGRCGAEIIVDSLSEHGVEYIFGIPGAKVDKLFDVLVDKGPKLVLCRHEQNAGFMAAMMGRLTGIPGVCLATSGPGVTNLLTPLITATTEGDPVVALGGAVSQSELHKSTHQTADTVSIFREATKYCVQLENVDSAAEIMSTAFRKSSAHRKGASFVSVPKNVLFDHSDVAQTTYNQMVKELGPAKGELLEKAAMLINQASLPVLFLGMDASEPKTAKAIRKLLDCVDIPVIATFQGAGVVPYEKKERFISRVGIFANEPGDVLLSKADLVITIGFDPVEYDPILWNEKGHLDIIHVDYDVAKIDHHYMPEVELLGDIAETVEAMMPRLEWKIGSAELELCKTLRIQGERPLAIGEKKKGGVVHPLAFVQALQKLCSNPDHTVICDVGSVYLWVARYFRSYEPRHLLFSNGQQTLGVALPWAMATCLARPKQKVVSISGDGAFLFTSMDLETAVRLKLNFVHFIWRDDSYDMVKIQQMQKYHRESGVALGNPDYVQYAKAFGAHGLRINSNDEILQVMKKAIELEGPVIVDVPIDYSDNHLLCEKVGILDIGQ